VAGLIAEQLKDIGMDVTVVQQSSNDLVREFLIPRQYQAAVFGLDTGPDPDPYPSWHSSQALEGGRNLAGYKNDEADRLMEEARVESSMDKRAALYRQFQQQFLLDTPSVLLYSHLYTYFVSRRIETVDPGLLFWQSSRFRNTNEWSVAASDQIGE
jgi:peptide/nickel transport system substrate-binding protein